MKLVLILMVRNESRILERCLKSVEGVVDAYCIHDTGSTDTTKEIMATWLRTHSGCASESEWKHFGYNRTASFLAAKEFVMRAEWDPKETYGLLLDADMEFSAGTLREQTLTEPGYSILQVTGSLEYPNCRLVRMDHPWVCRGVTHEYWDGPTKPLPRSVCFIHDRNDGGCKSDKFERDARLLEQGLKDDPTNVRYMFYLAQTYNSLGRWQDAIKLYKQRIKSGGWFEEIWYSHFMIGNCYLEMKDPIRFEAWMLRAHAYRPQRAEALYKLARYFRETSEHYKAWHYVQKGRSIAKPDDSLFLESSVYSHLFAYEATILLYYLGKHEEGLRETVKYLLANTEHADNVYRNLAFYVKPLGGEVVNHPVPREAAGADFHPTSVSICGEFQNVRFVNYIIDQRNGSYSMRDGTYSADNKVRTRNVLWDGKTATVLDESDTGLTLLPHRIEGLEDLRVYPDHTGAYRFVATCAQVGPKIRMVRGDYQLSTKSLRNCEVLEPPTDTSCEKNWLPVPSTNKMIYAWHPLQVGRIESGKLVVETTHSTPHYFRHLRGSAIPRRVGDELWVLVHSVEYSQPRKYFHSLVVLKAPRATIADPTDYKPLRMTLPFSFKGSAIEYCLGWTMTETTISFTASSWDDNPFVVTAPLSRLEWVTL